MMTVPPRIKLPAIALLAAVLLYLSNALLTLSGIESATAIFLVAYPIVALLLGGALRLAGANFGAALLTVTIVYLAVLYLQYGMEAYKYLPVYLLFAGIGVITAIIVEKYFERNVE